MGLSDERRHFAGPPAGLRLGQAVCIASMILAGWSQVRPVSAVELAVGDVIVARYSGIPAILHVDPATGAQDALPTANAVHSVLVEPAGTILLGRDRWGDGRAAILRLDPANGSTTDVVPSSYPAIPWGMAFDPAGRLLFTDMGNAAVKRVDLGTGEVTLISVGDELVYPTGLAVEASGEIVVADAGTTAGSVVRIDPETGEQTVLSAAGELRQPFGLAVTDDGSIYATSRGRIVRIDPLTGEQHIAAAGGFLNVLYSELAVDPEGFLLVWSLGASSTILEALVRVDPATGEQAVVTTVNDQVITPNSVGLAVVPNASCPATPATSCGGAARSTVAFKAGRGSKLVWKWAHGTIALADFGAPETAAKYSLCAYLDGLRILDAPIDVGGACNDRPCWRATRATGFSYRNRDGNDAGVTRLKLRAGLGKARIQATGAGANLALPALPLDFSGDLRVQLIRAPGKACWESSFTAFRRNSDRLFKATASATAPGS